EQALVDRAQLLDVQTRVLDPAAHPALLGPAAALGRILEGREVEQRAKKVLVAAGGGLQLAAVIAAEQYAVERGEAEHGGVLFVAEQKEGLLQALEQVAVAIAGEAPLGQLAHAGDAVPVGVDALAGGVLVVRHEQ